MARLAGAVEIAAGISLRGAQQKLTAGLRRLRGSVGVPVDPSFKKADAELAAWRRLQERNALNMRVKVDDRDLIRFERRFSRVEHVFKQSDLRRGIRVQIAVAGAAVLPVLAQGALSATAALTDLGRAAAALPGLFAGALGVVGTLATGLKGLGDAFSAAGDATKDATQHARDYERASRNLARAQRDIVQALKDANREIQDQRDKLTQGSLSVEQAQLNVARANERLAQGGFKSLTDYRQALLDIKQANFDLSTAVKQQGRDVQDYYDNANRAATQTDTFRDSLDKLATATESFTKAQNAANGISEKFIDAMKNLSPAARDFVNQILALRGAWRELQNDVQGTLLQGLGKEITDLANKRLPLLREGMKRVAAALNTDFKAVLQTLGSDRNASAISSIFRNIGAALTAAAPGLQSFVNAFLQLSEVSSRFLPRLGRAFSDVMGRFENFIARAEADGSLERWIDRGLNMLSSLGRSIGHIASIFGSLTTAYEKATGNIGGFATTAEKGLGKLASYLASPKGQNTLVKYLQDARRFIDEIKKSMPGIIDAFQAFSDAARQFAEIFFPIFARVGEFMERHPTLVKNAIAAYLGFRTVKPLLNVLTKFWDLLSVRADKYRAKVLEVKAAQQTLATQTPLLARSQRVSAQATQRYSQAFQNLRTANQRLVAAETAHIAALQQWGKDSEIVRRKAANLTVAQANQGAAVHRLRRAYLNHRGALQAVAQNTALVTDASRRLRERGFGGLIRKIGRAGSRAAGTLLGGLGALVGGIGGIAVTGTAMWAMYQWADANQKAGERVEYHRQRIEALQNQLDKTTGAVSEAAQTQALRDAQDFKVVGSDNKLIDANAVSDAEKLGLNAQQFANTFDPTQVEAINRFQASADASILAAVRSGKDDQWNRFGKALRDHGVTDEIYAKALRGDPESTRKFESAAAAMKNEIAPGFLPAPTGSIPDLGTGAENLLSAGVPGVASGQFQTSAVEANRAGGEATKQANQPVKLKEGRNPFAGAHDIFTQDGSSVSLVLDNVTPEQARHLQETTGATPTRLQVDPDTGIGRYQFEIFSDLNKWFQGFRHGGMAHGPLGDDRIPAMLSDGEFVMRPEAVKHWGLDAMYWMNSVPKLSDGGDPDPLQWIHDHLGGRGGGFNPQMRIDTSHASVQHPAESALLGKGTGSFYGSRRLDYTDYLGWLQDSAATRSPTAIRYGFAVGGLAGFKLFEGADGPGVGPRGNDVAPKGGKTIPKVPPPPSIFGNAATGVRPKPSFTLPLPLDAPSGNRPGANPLLAGPAAGFSGRMFPTPSASIPGMFLGDAPRVDDLFGRPTGLPGSAWQPREKGRWPGPLGQLPVPKPIAPKPIGPSAQKPAPPAPPPITHFPGGSARPGPGGASAAPGVPGVVVVPGTTPRTPSTPPPAAPGAIPTYEQLGSVLVATGVADGHTGSEAGLQVNTLRVKRAVESLFPQITSIGGVRPDSLKWHPNGLAADVMIPGFDTPEGIGLGNQVLEYFRAHMADFGVDYIIWRGNMYYPDGRVEKYNGANPHNDHLHINTTGGGKPTGQEQFTLPGVGPVTPPPPPPGSIAEGIPGVNAEIPGPFGPVPFQPIDFLKQIGQAILQAIFGFFGIDISSILGPINQAIQGFPGAPQQQDTALPADPGPDQTVIQQLVDQAAEAKAAGNKPLAESLLQAARDYQSRGATSAAPTASSILGSLTTSSSKQDIGKAIISEALSRGYSRDQAVAILSTAMQESGLNPTIQGGGGAWHGIFQQDSGYPGRDDPNQNIKAFFDRLGSKGGPNGDIWKNIFWLQQRPGEKSAEAAFNNGRQAYLSEIQSQLGSAEEMAAQLGFATGGHVRGPGGPTADKIPALLSDGEFVMRAAAVKHWGLGRLSAMNRMAGGGPVDPNLPFIGPAAQGPPGQANGQLPLIGPAAAGPAQPAPGPNQPLIGNAALPSALSGAAGHLGAMAGAVLAPKGAGGGGGAPPQPTQDQTQDPRSILGAPPSSENHLHPSIRAGIEGAFNTIGALAGSAAGAAVGAGLAATPGAQPAAGPAASAASQLTAAGFQMAGQVASGAANVLSSLLVGTVTPGTTGRGSGVPLLPQPSQAPPSYTSVHNGNIVAYNPEEAFRLKERKEAQNSAAFFNRVPNV